MMVTSEYSRICRLHSHLLIEIRILLFQIISNLEDNERD